MLILDSHWVSGTITARVDGKGGTAPAGCTEGDGWGEAGPGEFVWWCSDWREEDSKVSRADPLHKDPGNRG